MLLSFQMLNFQTKGFLLFASLILPLSTATNNDFQGCNYLITLYDNYYLNSPFHYEGSYCRYKFVAPYDKVIQATCNINFYIYNNYCTSEFFYIVNEDNLAAATPFCGYRNINTQSAFQTIVIAYESFYLNEPYKNQTGRFTCDLKLVPKAPDCGWSLSRRIVNGEYAQVNEYPSAVAIRKRSGTQPLACGGSIISYSLITTAAHCFIKKTADELYVQLGKNNISDTHVHTYEAIYLIEKIFVHEKYNPNNSLSFYDIALLKTVNNIEWSRGVGPICLPFLNYNQDFTNELVDVIGWGTTSFGGPISNILEKVQLQIANFTDCEQNFPGIQREQQLCTYDYLGVGKDSCQFDSGGGNILKKNRHFLIGIVSFGRGCGVPYGMAVNTRVAKHLNWIWEKADSVNSKFAMQPIR